MKLLRYMVNGKPAVGIAKGDGFIPLARVAPEYSEVREVAAAGRTALDRITKAVASASAEFALSEATLLPPIERPGNILRSE